jgi:hypothetical protein
MTKEDTRFNAIGICPGDGRTRLKEPCTALKYICS